MSSPTQIQIATLLASLNLAALEQAIRDAQPGQPGGTSYDPRTTNGQGPADPTGDAASRAVDSHAGSSDLVLFTKLRDQTYTGLLGLIALREAHTPNHARPRTWAKAETKGCALHIRAGVEAHREARFTTDFADVMDSPLKDPVPVCRWCYDFPRRIHPDGDPIARLPTKEEIVTYENTGRLRLKARPKKRKAA